MTAMYLPNSENQSDYSDYGDYYNGSSSISIGDYCPHSMEPAHPAVKVFLTICFALTIVFCGIGNSTLTFIIFTKKRLRTVTNLLIANLAVSDALLAMMCAPFSLHFYLHDNWVFGDVMCPLVGSVKFISLFVSVNTLLVIAVDRFVGIFDPLRPRMRKGTLLLIVSAIWIVSILVALPTPLYLRVNFGFDCKSKRVIKVCVESWTNLRASKGYIVFITVVEFFIPTVVMAFIYVKIAQQLWFHRRPPGNETARHREITLVRKQKIIPMLVVLVISFVVCWGPYYGYTLAQHMFTDEFEWEMNQLQVFYIVESIAMLNSVISTVIYFLMSPVFREELSCLYDKLSSPCQSKRTSFTKVRSQTTRTGSNMSQTHTRNGAMHFIPKSNVTAEARL